MKVAIVDYEMGNLFSLQNALRAISHNSVLTRSRRDILNAEHVILPGVGSADPAMTRLSKYELADALIERSKRGGLTSGICLGMQLMATMSAESACQPVKCLNLIPASVNLIAGASSRAEGIRLPSIGWYKTDIFVQAGKSSNTWMDRFHRQRFYYIHSYHMSVSNQNHLFGSYDYSHLKITSVVGSGPNMAVQFHPEKSGATGLEFLSCLINRKA